MTAYPQYRVAWRYPDELPRTCKPLSGDAARKHFRYLAAAGVAAWVELQSRPSEGKAWEVIDWRGVRLTGLNGRRIDGRHFPPAKAGDHHPNRRTT